MLKLKDICSKADLAVSDVPNPEDEEALSIGEEGLLFINWPADVEGRNVKVRISAIELSDLNGQGICDKLETMAALRSHREYIEDRANALLIEGADEVVLDIGSLVSPFTPVRGSPRLLGFGRRRHQRIDEELAPAAGAAYLGRSPREIGALDG